MKFYVVTMSGSLYLVSDEKVNGTPTLQKLIPRPIGRWRKGPRFSGGTHIGVGTFGMVHLFTRRRGMSADDMNIREFGGHTSKVVGLFLKLGKAMKCWKCVQQKKPWDKNWIKSTRKTLLCIGGNHSVFVLSFHSLFENGVLDVEMIKALRVDELRRENL